MMSKGKHMRSFGLSAAALLLSTTTTPLWAQTPIATSVEAPAAAAAGVIFSPEAIGLRDALLSGGPDLAAVEAVYAARDYAPIWSRLKAASLTAALSSAERHGLPAERYELAVLQGEQDVDGVDPQREVELTQAFLRYARDVNSGVLEPQRVDTDIVVLPKRPDPAALLEGMAETPDPISYLQALAPSHRHYTDLLEEKTRLERLISLGGWGGQIPGGKTLRPGDASPRVIVLRARLGAMFGTDMGEELEYDGTLVDFVKSFQLRHGLNDDGVVGPKTLAAMNANPQDRLKQVLVNLERQRWLNYDRGSRHIYVNQADFSVRVIDHGETTYVSRVVIGKNRHRTQEFNDEMTYMVVNPTWHVPRSIATEEMLPKLKANPAALGDSMQIMTRGGTRVNPRLIDFTQFTESNFPFLVKQSPGRANALGRVKFMFPNQFNIYLHDTPAKNLFSRDARAYSHGCVRVQKPFELAEVLLALQTEDPKGTFERYLGGGRERHVNLEKPVPVYLTYQSAWVDRFGVPQYRDDIYGRDGRVFDALSQLGVTLGAVEG